VGLGWDVKTTDTGFDFDLDSSAFLLGTNEKLISDSHFIFYNNLVSPDPGKSVQHTGDNLTGVGEGDDVDSEPTPLQQRMTQLGNVLVTGSLILVAIVVLAGIIQARGFSNIQELLEVSLSMAVAVVPEGLPAVITGETPLKEL